MRTAPVRLPAVPRWVGPALTLTVVTAAFVLLRRSLPDPGTVLRSMVDTEWWWLAAALLVQAGSVLMYAVQQRRLLAAYGGAMSTGRAIGVSLARTALSTAMPAGGPVSTAFAVRQFRLHGLTSAAALATTTLASVQASAAVVLVYLAWCVTATIGAMSVPGLLVTAAVVTLLCPAAVALRRHLTWRPAAPGPLPLPGSLPAAGRGLIGLGTDTIRACCSLPARHWLETGGAATARRVFDLACFVAVAHAYDLGTATKLLVGAYLTGQLVRQIPLVAGGAGLVEASLLASLVAAGAAAVTAAAVVLTYRLLSCWLIALAGLPVVIGLGTTRQPAAAPAYAH